MIQIHVDRLRVQYRLIFLEKTSCEVVVKRKNFALVKFVLFRVSVMLSAAQETQLRMAVYIFVVLCC